MCPLHTKLQKWEDFRYALQSERKMCRRFLLDPHTLIISKIRREQLLSEAARFFAEFSPKSIDKPYTS
jgi:hypothetical protein